MTFSTTYQRAYNCVGGERPGARALQDFLLEQVGQLPGCVTIDSGIYNCRNIGRTGRKSVHSEGRAGDTGVRHPDGAWPTVEIPEPGIWEWCDRLIDNAAELGIQYVIYARKARFPGGVWKEYTGESPHFDHIHWELTREAADALTPATIRAVLSPPSATEGAPFMLESFIAVAFHGKRGYSPFQSGQDLAGALHWVRAAGEENPDSLWTWQDCLDSPTLGVMVALLLAEPG